MEKLFYSKDVDNLIYLLSCAINNTVPDAIQVGKMNLERIFQLSSAHSLVAMVAFSLEKVIELPYSFDQQKKKVLRKLALFDVERFKLFEQFEKNEIWYVPLKGVILKDYYPQYGMREMADNDILCDADRMLDIKRIMEELGFQCKEYGKRVDDTYVKFPVVFEMHRFLFDERESDSFFWYFNEIKNKLIPVVNHNYEFGFLPEDFYIYMIAHEYKHYTCGGTGIRSLLDTYVYLKRFNGEMDWEYIFCELKKLGLGDFESNNRELSFAVFSEKLLNDKQKDSLLYYVSSGVYGTADHSLSNRIAKSLSGDDSNNAKKKFLIERILLSDQALKNQFPFFYKHKALLPFLFVFRAFRGLFTRPKQLFQEYKELKRFKYSE